MSKRKEDFFVHELILLHTTTKIKKEKEEIKKDKKKNISKNLIEIISKFLKDNHESSYTCNSLKKEIKYKGRVKLIQDELDKLVKNGFIKCFKGFRSYNYYHWNNDPKETSKELVVDELLKEEDSLTEDECNSDTGEHDDTFY